MSGVLENTPIQGIHFIRGFIWHNVVLRSRLSEMPNHLRMIKLLRSKRPNCRSLRGCTLSINSYWLLLSPNNCNCTVLPQYFPSSHTQPTRSVTYNLLNILLYTMIKRKYNEIGFQVFYTIGVAEKYFRQKRIIRILLYGKELI